MDKQPHNAEIILPKVHSDINHKNKALGASLQLRAAQYFCDALMYSSGILNCKRLLLLLKDRLDINPYAPQKNQEQIRSFGSQC